MTGVSQAAKLLGALLCFFIASVPHALSQLPPAFDSSPSVSPAGGRLGDLQINGPSGWLAGLPFSGNPAQFLNGQGAWVSTGAGVSLGPLISQAATGCAYLTTTAACRTPAAEQADKVDVDQFGAIGDGNSHPITNPLYIAQFCPQATAAGVTNPEQDACSFQAAINYAETLNGTNAWGATAGSQIHFTGHGHPYIFGTSGGTNGWTPVAHNVSLKIEADGPNPVEVQVSNYAGFLSFGAGDIAAGGLTGSLDIENISTCTYSAGGLALYVETKALHPSFDSSKFRATGCGGLNSGHGFATHVFGYGLHDSHHKQDYFRAYVGFPSGWFQAASNTANSITFGPATTGNGVTMPPIPTNIAPYSTIDDFTTSANIPSPCFVLPGQSGQTLLTSCALTANTLAGDDIRVATNGYIFESPSSSFGLYFDQTDVNATTGGCYVLIAKTAPGIQTVGGSHADCGGSYDDLLGISLSGGGLDQVDWEYGEAQIEGDYIFGYNMSHLSTDGNLFYIGSGRNSPEPTAYNSGWMFNLTGNLANFNSIGAKDQIAGVYGNTPDYAGFFRNEGLNINVHFGTSGDGGVSRVNAGIESIGNSATGLLGPFRFNMSLNRNTSATIASTSTYLSFDTLPYNAAKFVSPMDGAVDLTTVGSLAGCQVSYVSGTNPGPYQVHMATGCAMPSGGVPAAENIVFEGPAVTNTFQQVKAFGTTAAGSTNIQLEPWQIPGNAGNPFALLGDGVSDLNNQLALPVGTTVVSLNYTTGIMVVSNPVATGQTITGGGKYTGDTLLIKNATVSSVPTMNTSLVQTIVQASADKQLVDNCSKTYVSIIAGSHIYPPPNPCVGMEVTLKDAAGVAGSQVEQWMGLSDVTQQGVTLTQKQALTFKYRAQGDWSITSAYGPAIIQNPTSTAASCNGTLALNYPTLPVYEATIKIPISGACTITVANPNATVSGLRLNLVFVQGSTGYAVTLPASADGATPTVSSAVNGRTAIQVNTPGDGNNYLAVN